MALGLGLLQSQANAAVSNAAVSIDISQFDLIRDWLGHLYRYVSPYRSNLITFFVNLVYALIATFLFRLSLKFLRRYYRRIYRQIYRLQRRWLSSVRIQDLELINSKSMSKGLIFIARGLRFAIFALLVYLYIPFLLNLSPWTQQLGETLFRALLSGIGSITLGVLSYIPNLITILLIVTVAYCLIKLSFKIFNEVGKGHLTIPGFYSDWASPTANLLSAVIIAFAAVLTFPYLPGGNSPALQGVSLFVGVLVSLGSTAVIGNLISGIVLIYTRAFSKGDRVTIGGVTGNVVEETLLVTRIRTVKNKIVTIPNGMVLGSYIVNFSDSRRNNLDSPLIVHTMVTLGYDVPWREVHEVLIKAAKATKYVLSDPPPFVLQKALNDFYVSYELNAYTDHPLRLEVIESELHQHIQDQCNQSGIEIISPHYSAMRDGNRTTIPSNYLSPDYVSPQFQVGITNHQLRNFFEPKDK